MTVLHVRNITHLIVDNMKGTGNDFGPEFQVKNTKGMMRSVRLALK